MEKALATLPPLRGDGTWPILITIAQLLIAVRFFLDSLGGGFAMAPTVHGFAVWWIPAEAWSGVLIFVHGAILYGLLVPTRCGVYVLLTGAITGTVVNLFFSIASQGAEFGGIVVYFAEGLLAPLCVLFTIQGVVELRSDRQRR